MRSPEARMAHYIAAVRNSPELSREEELALARAYRAGDAAAGNRLAASCLRHVVAVALMRRAYGVPLGDLIAEGNVGVAHALRKFDPERGNRFVTYAVWWIRAYILQHIIATWSVVGGSKGALRSKMFFKLRRERARCEAQLGRGEAADEKLAASFGVTVEELRAKEQRIELRDVSVGSPVHEDQDMTVGDLLEDEAALQEDRLGRSEHCAVLRGVVAEALATLSPREKAIARHRLMADPEEGLSLQDLATEWGVSRERVRQVEARLVRRLRLRLAPHREVA